MADEHCYSVQHAFKGGNEATQEQFRTFDDIICQFMTEQGIPGLGLAVSYHDNIIYTQGYGTAGVNRRVTSHSTFRIASISKPLTAIAIMRLVESGHLSLDKKVFGPTGILCEFKPATKGDKRVLQITIKHLLQHSAGWDRDVAGDPVFFNLDAIDTRDGPVSAVSQAFNMKLVKYMMRKKLQFSPGKRHAYSNFGYLVLGLVLERVTGLEYEIYMRDMFSHCGLTQLRVGCTRRVLCDINEVEYFNNREPALLKSIFPDEGLVLPQYGSYSMENTGAYGGWVTSPCCLLQILHNLQGTNRHVSQKLSTSTVSCLDEYLTCPSFVSPDDHIQPSDGVMNKCSRSTPLLKAESVSLMLERPGYQEGNQWYGLGLDVQDSGLSFGHTGAMEGSCGTMMSHKSGFSWALLMNAWSRDMDLDGLMKYALSTVEGYPLYYSMQCGVSLLEVTSADEAERVMLLVPHCEVVQKISHEQLSGYTVSYISSCEDNLKVYFNIIFRKCKKNYHFHFDISSNDILSVVNNESRRNYHPEVLSAYVVDSKILHCIIFKEHVDTRHKVLQPLSAKAYLERQKAVECRESVSCQCVTSVGGELFVSALVSETDQDAVSWLQISAEEFLVEQKRQLKRGRDLRYVQFYSLGEDPYVSAVWWRKPDVSDRLQRYGASRFGLLQELREAAAANLRLQALSPYVSEGVVNFAAVWNPVTV